MLNRTIYIGTPTSLKLKDNQLKLEEPLTKMVKVFYLYRRHGYVGPRPLPNHHFLSSHCITPTKECRYY